jgi:hypothetical protein
MFWGYYIIIAFIIGLPISFGIGSLIGYIVWRISNAKQGKKKTIILTGIAYIISQPISYIVGALFKVHVFNAFFLVPFALVFTTVVSIVITKIVNRRNYNKVGI